MANVTVILDDRRSHNGRPGQAGTRQNAPGSRILRREMVPDDIVGAVRFQAGPLSGFMTGQTIVVDGGAYLH